VRLGRGLLIVLAVTFVSSGIAGIAVGGASAAAGWWLVIVFGTLSVVALVGRPTRRNARHVTRRAR
jgi:hypothetical protein